MLKTKSIDYLFEDPVISGQKYALISIVGPHMPQKCDTWGLKIRGTADTIEAAKAMTKRIMSIDENYDIYTVEVGKFFPLAVEPYQLNSVEYQNSQLNQLIKTYLENKETAKDHFNKRKNEMIQQAIIEGKNQEEMANRPEHPVSILQRIRNFEESIEKTRENLSDLEQDLQVAKDKFSSYSEEEREVATREMQNLLQSATEDSAINVEEVGADNNKIIVDAMHDLGIIQTSENDETNQFEFIQKKINELQAKETELQEATQLRESMDESKSPNVYKRLSETIMKLNNEIIALKDTLNNNEKINDFINANYTTSSYDFESEPKSYSQASK